MSKNLRILVACGLLALSGTSRGEEPSKLEEAGFYASFLLDEDAVLGCGHAALLFGNDKAGWQYVSFAPRPDGSDNVHHLRFSSFAEARKSAALARYGKYLLWSTSDSSVAAKAQRRLENHGRERRTIPSAAIASTWWPTSSGAAGLDINADYTIPVAAYDANRGRVQKHGQWAQASITE